MPIFDENNIKQLTEIINKMDKPVNVVYFTDHEKCGACALVEELLLEISHVNNKISLTKFIFQIDKEKTEIYNIDKIPAILLLDNNFNDTRVRFYGTPIGHEINPFLRSILEISGINETLPENIDNRIKAINKNIQLKVFVTSSCPYCSIAVMQAHLLAIRNVNVRSEMIEAVLFPELTEKYSVTNVPKIIINENNELSGAQPIESLLEIIEKI